MYSSGVQKHKQDCCKGLLIRYNIKNLNVLKNNIKTPRQYIPIYMFSYSQVSYTQTDRRRQLKQAFCRFATTSKVKPYIHQCCLRNWNKFPSWQHDFLISHIDDETETAYKRDRSSDPLTAPRRLSHTLSLKYKKLD